MHRSGTYFLEKKVFKNLKDVNYIDMRDKHKQYYKKYYLKITDSKLTEKDFKIIKSFINKKATKQKNLISYEGFSGVNYMALKKKSFSDVFKDVRRLVEGFDFKIILVLREQSSFITSLYKRYICRGGYEDIYNFIKTQIHLPNHDYYSYVKKLEEIFGAGNIYILLFENFLSSDTTNRKKETIKKLLDFIGERKMPKLDTPKNPNSKLSKLRNRVMNKGYEKLQINISRLINPLFRSDFNPDGFFPGVLPVLTSNSIEFKFIPEFLLKNRFFEAISDKYDMPKELQRRIKRFYFKSNKKLDNEYSLNLPEVYFK